MKILYASNNQDKINDVKQSILFINENIEVVGLKETGFEIEVEETGSSLLENATLKAKTVYELIKNKINFDFVIGEDFGFYVDAFSDVAGIHAKRWMEGSNLDRAAAIVKLFKETKEKNKKATFSCAMYCIDKNGNTCYALEHLTGNIGTRLPKKKGFGYHQIVKMEDGRYLSDYSVEEKKNIWVRQKALHSILKQLNLVE